MTSRGGVGMFLACLEGMVNMRGGFGNCARFVEVGDSSVRIVSVWGYV